MFRQFKDFERGWAREMDSTLKVLRNLTDDSLQQAVVPGGRTLGFLGWHLVLAFGPLAAPAGFKLDLPSREALIPTRAAEIVAAYEKAAKGILEQTGSLVADETLTENVPFFSRSLPRGEVLNVIILHQTHHRGQMTVLMRQAGLAVPGVYGPAREEWVAMGMPAPV